MFRMRTMLPVSLGYAAGYVMGTRSGRPTYDRLKATVGKYAEGYGLTHDGQSSTELANEELADLRAKEGDGPSRVGFPDEGREHGPTVAP
jgi:hypothetical protein